MASSPWIGYTGSRRVRIDLLSPANMRGWRVPRVPCTLASRTYLDGRSPNHVRHLGCTRSQSRLPWDCSRSRALSCPTLDPCGTPALCAWLQRPWSAARRRIWRLEWEVSFFIAPSRRKDHHWLHTRRQCTASKWIQRFRLWKYPWPTQSLSLVPWLYIEPRDQHVIWFIMIWFRRLWARKISWEQIPVHLSSPSRPRRLHQNRSIWQARNRLSL